jgi:hypothetical protein
MMMMGNWTNACNLHKTILFEIYLHWHCETSDMEKQEFLIKIFQSYHEKCWITHQWLNQQKVMKWMFPYKQL